MPTTPVWPFVGDTGLAVTIGARPVALKDTGEPAAPATVVVAVMVPISGPSVQVADASPAASLTVCAGRMVPAETAQSTVTPALGSPSDSTRTLSGSGSSAPTTPICPFVGSTGVTRNAAGADGSEHAASQAAAAATRTA